MGARGYGGRWRNGAGFLWISRPAVRPRRCSALGGELGSVRFAVGGTSWAQTVWSRGRMTERRSWSWRVIERCRRLAFRLHRAGTWNWIWAAGRFCGYGVRRRVEPGGRGADLDVHPSDRHAALVRRALGAGAQRVRRGSDERELVCLRESAQDDAEDSGVRRGRLLDLVEASGARAIRGAGREPIRQASVQPDGSVGADRGCRYCR